MLVALDLRLAVGLIGVALPRRVVGGLILPIPLLSLLTLLAGTTLLGVLLGLLILAGLSGRS